MRFVLADVRSADGSCRKEAGCGFGERLRPLSRAIRLAHRVAEHADDLPSPVLATLAGLLAKDGHQVHFTRAQQLEGDIAIVRSSLVDHKNETRWASEARARGLRVGFVGVAASRMPDLFAPAADLVIHGEPEEVVLRWAQGERIEGLIASQPVANPAGLPLPRWDLLGITARRGVRLPLEIGRGGNDLCDGCPHGILGPRKTRSVENLVAELIEDCRRYERPGIVIADPRFTEDRDLVLPLCEAIRSHALAVRLECEARLDRLDPAVLETLAGAGLEVLTLVEACNPATIVDHGRRDREILAQCDRLGIQTIGSYVLGGLDQTWDTTAALIDRAISLGTTLARFRVLTPYPGTMLWGRLQTQITESDFERFDGFSLTFRHPHLSADELQFLFAAAHARFYLRPSFLARLWHLDRLGLRGLVDRLDVAAHAWHSRRERSAMSRTAVIS